MQQHNNFDRKLHVQFGITPYNLVCLPFLAVAVCSLVHYPLPPATMLGRNGSGPSCSFSRTRLMASWEYPS